LRTHLLPSICPDFVMNYIHYSTSSNSQNLHHHLRFVLLPMFILICLFLLYRWNNSHDSSSSRPRLVTMLLLNFLFLLLSGRAYAQFNFFDMFGQQQQQQQQQRPSGASQWASHSDSVSCSQYLCPDTHLCVDRAAACPCPDEQDIKCLVPDASDSDGATVVCVRGGNECAEVKRLMRKHMK